MESITDYVKPGNILIRRDKKGIKVFGFWTEESEEIGMPVMRNIIAARVRQVKPDAYDKIQIEIDVPNQIGNFDTYTKWIDLSGWYVLQP